ncbi:hypothetical protein KB879_36580 (plasmid) [Cupriavidus sp. KK10]|jgi:hypothetical protein|uniref:hypothetical protein n=1 Tax=Cupriavidus sp. KK10 TaxID=1478019 RepID=UPI001BA817DB|nr:hypothetical protein [Cupriavidus sp. KK10]QUN31844.1 hypothetical protein KB879_36580 [Cupriavidus sp. KK10]
MVWFIDDMDQVEAAQAIRPMQLLLARRIAEHALPPHVTLVAATNRRVDNSGVFNILDPLVGLRGPDALGGSYEPTAGADCIHAL